MSHKILCFALCSAHSVLIFDNYIILMVATLICMQIFPQISFCSISTTISKLICYRHFKISIFPSNPPPFRNLDHLLFSLMIPSLPKLFMLRTFTHLFSLHLAYSVNCQTLFCFWKVVIHFLPPLTEYRSFPSIHISLYLALLLSARSVCPVYCHYGCISK